MTGAAPPSDTGPLHPELLADARGAWVGVWLRPSGPVAQLDHHATWVCLSGTVPGFMTHTDWSTYAGESAAPPTGLTLISDDTLLACETRFPDTVSPPTRWLTGAWYLAMAPKPHAAQAASRQRALRLMQLVMDDAETHELEEVFRQDAALSYQLLRLVNSAVTGSRREVTSFAQAIAMMGRQPLKRWLNLLLFAARDDDVRSAMLMAHVVIRARGMERLAAVRGLDKGDQEQAFMAGMFSLLDRLIGQPLVDILRPIRVTDSLQSALLEQQGQLGALLKDWSRLESGERDAHSEALLAEAMAWAYTLVHQTPASGRG